jgi:ATP-dependent Clp protease ATP-binding subunit ClpB
MVNDELERMPHVYGGSEPSLSPRLRALLEAAWREMGTFHDEYLSVEHILLGMFDVSDAVVQSALKVVCCSVHSLAASDAVVQSALKAAGLTRENVLQALTSIRGAQRVTDPNPEGKY